jgi:uncharacterized protein (TIGR02678 family)
LKELEILLENFWITKEEDKELYYGIKDASPRFKDFIEEKLGYKLIINPYMIKLEKLPGRAEAWMGIPDFDERMDYAFYCLLLVFLEDKGAGEQFVLSEITEFVQAAFPGKEKADWTLFRHRRSMVKVLRFAVELQLLQVDDGNETGFMDSAETEVLYESTGLSRYFMRTFTGNILHYTSLEDMENGEWLEADRDRGRVRRNRVYRRLFMSPAVYSEGADDPDYLYIKNKRSLLQKDIEDMLGSQLHVHKNGAFLVLNPNRHFKDVFPDNKGISDIVLQLNGLIVHSVKEKEIEKQENDILVISRAGFDRLVETCREKYLHGWSKEYREMRPDKLCEEILSHMKGFCMLETCDHGREVRVLPLAGKIIGQYPMSFGNDAGGSSRYDAIQPEAVG